MATTKVATEIQQAAIYRCTTKATQDVVYLVKSDTQANTWYTVSFDRISATWSCSCPAMKPCNHERAAQEVLKLRREAKKQEQIATAAQVAPLVLGSAFASDLSVHVDDAMPAQPAQVDASEQVYQALPMGRVVDARDLAKALGMGIEMVCNCLTVLQRGKQIVLREVSEGVYWVSTPEQAYRDAYPSDFAA